MRRVVTTVCVPVLCLPLVAAGPGTMGEIGEKDPVATKWSTATPPAPGQPPVPKNIQWPTGSPAPYGAAIVPPTPPVRTPTAVPKWWRDDLGLANPDFEAEGLAGWGNVEGPLQVGMARNCPTKTTLESTSLRIGDRQLVTLGGDYWHVPFEGVPNIGLQGACGLNVGPQTTVQSPGLKLPAGGRHLGFLARGRALGGAVDLLDGRGKLLATVALRRTATLERYAFDVAAAAFHGVPLRLRVRGGNGGVDLDDIRLSDAPPPQFTAAQTAWQGPVWGFADVHVHPLAHQAMGGLKGVNTVWGVPGGKYDDYVSDPSQIDVDVPACGGVTHNGGLLSAPLLNFFDARLGSTVDYAGKLLEGFLFHQRGHAGEHRHEPWSVGVHQQHHVTQLRRAYDGGLRLMSSLAVNNELFEFAMSEFPNGRTSLVEQRKIVDAHVCGMKQLAAKNAAWMEIAYTPEDARRIAAANRLAIVLGVEFADLGNMGFAGVEEEVQYLYDLGIRQVTVTHSLDNKLGGAAAFMDGYNWANDFLSRPRDRREKWSIKDVDLDPNPGFYRLREAGCPRHAVRGECVLNESGRLLFRVGVDHNLDFALKTFLPRFILPGGGGLALDPCFRFSADHRGQGLTGLCVAKRPWPYVTSVGEYCESVIPCQDLGECHFARNVCKGTRADRCDEKGVDLLGGGVAARNAACRVAKGTCGAATGAEKTHCDELQPLVAEATQMAQSVSNLVVTSPGALDFGELLGRAAGTALINLVSAIKDELLKNFGVDIYHPMVTTALNNAAVGLSGAVNARGLSDDGKRYVKALMDRGMLIDISHLSDASRFDAMSLAYARSGCPSQNAPPQPGNPISYVFQSFGADSCWTDAYPLMWSHVNFRAQSIHQRQHGTASAPWMSPMYATDDGFLPSEFEVAESHVRFIRRTGGLIGLFMNQNPIDPPPDQTKKIADDDCGVSSKGFAQALLYANQKMEGRGVALGSDAVFHTMTGPRFGPSACAGGEHVVQRGVGLVRYKPLEQRGAVAYTTPAHPVVAGRLGGNQPLIPYSWNGRTSDYNLDGWAHYGMVPDQLQDTRNVLAGNGLGDEMKTLFRGAQDYIDMWAKARRRSTCTAATCERPRIQPDCGAACNGTCPDSDRRGAPRPTRPTTHLQLAESNVFADWWEESHRGVCAARNAPAGAGTPAKLCEQWIPCSENLAVGPNYPCRARRAFCRGAVRAARGEACEPPPLKYFADMQRTALDWDRNEPVVELGACSGLRGWQYQLTGRSGTVPFEGRTCKVENSLACSPNGACTTTPFVDECDFGVPTFPGTHNQQRLFKLSATQARIAGGSPCVD